MKRKKEKGIVLYNQAAAAVVLLLLIIIMAATCGKSSKSSSSSRSSTPPPRTKTVYVPKVETKTVYVDKPVKEKPPEAPQGPGQDTVQIEQDKAKTKVDDGANKKGQAEKSGKTAFHYLLEGCKALKKESPNFPEAVRLLTLALDKKDGFKNKTQKAGAYWNRAIAHKGNLYEKGYKLDLERAEQLDSSVVKKEGLDVTNPASIRKAMYEPDI